VTSVGESPRFALEQSGETKSCQFQFQERADVKTISDVPFFSFFFPSMPRNLPAVTGPKYNDALVDQGLLQSACVPVSTSDFPKKHGLSGKAMSTRNWLVPVVIVALSVVIVWSLTGNGPDEAANARKRGDSLWKEADFPGAIAAYTEVIRLDVKDAHVYWRRGLAYMATRKPDKAITDFTEAIRVSPTYADAYCCRGVAYSSVGEHDHAISDFTDALGLNPKDGDTYLGRGTAYGRKGDLGKAIADMSEAIRLRPNIAVAYWGRGSCYEKKGDHSKAFLDFSEAIRLDANFGGAYFGRAVVYDKMGEKAKAEEDAAKAKKLGYKGGLGP
jgi:tetratricopeptide (TPR) repeat protein